MRYVQRAKKKKRDLILLLLRSEGHECRVLAFGGGVVSVCVLYGTSVGEVMEELGDVGRKEGRKKGVCGYTLVLNKARYDSVIRPFLTNDIRSHPQKFPSPSERCLLSCYLLFGTIKTKNRKMVMIKVYNVAEAYPKTVI